MKAVLIIFVNRRMSIIVLNKGNYANTTLYVFFKRTFPDLFFNFCLFYSAVDNIFMKFLLLSGIEPQITGVGSHHTANCATTISVDLK